MSRFRRPRSELGGKDGRPRSSIETWLALSLSASVVVSSAALVRLAPDYSHSFADVPADPRAGFLSRQERMLKRTDVRPELVILLALDGLRADRLAKAPNLSALAAEGIAFSTVGAQSSGPLISHKSLLTGCYPFTLLHENSGADLVALAAIDAPHEYLEAAFSGVRGTLAAGLRDNGYRTAAFTDGGRLTVEHGFAHGFDVFDARGGGLESSLPRALGWLATHAGQQRFLFLQSSALARADAASYDATLAATDELASELFRELERSGQLARALVVVTSGHGVSLGEHGAVGHGGLELEQLLVPLFLRFPARWGFEDGVVDEPVELVDLLPTLYALCGIAIPRPLDGSSLLPILFRGIRGKGYLLAQTAFDEDGRGSNAAARSLLRPERWQVIQDARLEEALFLPLGRTAGPAALAIDRDEFAPFFAALLDGPRTARARSARARAELSEALERELAVLGYARR